jgi:hypothetical protein
MQEVLLGYMTEATPQTHHPRLALRYLIFLLTSISVQKQYRYSYDVSRTRTHSGDPEPVFELSGA